jgi:hypothetical protein
MKYCFDTRLCNEDFYNGEAGKKPPTQTQVWWNGTQVVVTVVCSEIVLSYLVRIAYDVARVVATSCC